MVRTKQPANPYPTQKIVMVNWIDPSSFSSWGSIAECFERKMAEQWSVGWLIVDEPDRISVALTMAYDLDTVSDTITLPRGCIKTIQEVK